MCYIFLQENTIVMSNDQKDGTSSQMEELNTQAHLSHRNTDGRNWDLPKRKIISVF